MSFVSAYHDRRQGKVLVWEKTSASQRVRKLYDAPHYFYARKPNGAFTTVTGVQVEKIDCDDANEFDNLIAEYKMRRIPMFESDVSPLERVLMDNYSTLPAPELTVGMLDIEVDYDPSIGFAGPQNPYAPISSVTLHSNGQMKTVAVPPPSWRWGEDQLPERLRASVTLVKTELELLELMLDLIHPCDVLSGWNSEYYDIPYIARRVELVLGEHVLDRLALEGGPSPRWTQKSRFKHSKEKVDVIDLVTRIHLDYQRLFQKFNLTKRQSYSLDNVSFEELGEKKLTYDGSLAELYRADFVKFIDYNIHDVVLLLKLDAKFKYIELANQMVHMATINFSSVFGSVQLIDTAIMNYAHNVLHKIVCDRVETGPNDDGDDSDPVEGAIVVTPNTGFYEWIGACDINSLYPSTIRSLNLSIEKLVGQLLGPSIENNGWKQVQLKQAEATTVVAKRYEVSCVVHRNELTTWASWTYRDTSSLDRKRTEYETRYGDTTSSVDKPQDDAMYDANEYSWRVYQRVVEDPDSPFKDMLFDVKFDGDSQVLSMPMSALIEYTTSAKLAVSAFGTLVDQGNGQGLVPEVLTSWFKGRKEMQAEKKKYGKLKSTLLASGKAEADPEVLEAKQLEAYYDMLQGVRKVLLNSAYGAMLNGYCRFGDPRLGASVTYTGRQITSFMIDTVSKYLSSAETPPVLVKSFDPLSKKDSKTGTEGKHNLTWGKNSYSIDIVPGEGPIYGDTDSVYFTYSNIIAGVDDIDVIIEAANAVADGINNAFPGFMRRSFNCHPGYDDLIKANRELVCRSGLIQAKKKYMMIVVDKEGKRVKPGDEDELKTMGSDIKLSSTPEVIRTLLTDVVMKLLYKRPKAEIDAVVMNFRRSMHNDEQTEDERINPLDLATVVSVNNLDEATAKWELYEKRSNIKAKISPNARMAINHNYMIEHFKATDEALIKSGDKIKVIWLKDNQFGFKNIAFSSDIEKLPAWFTANFEVDKKLMEQKLVDQKLELIFTAVGWEVPTFQTELNNNLLDF